MWYTWIVTKHFVNNCNTSHEGQYNNAVRQAVSHIHYHYSLFSCAIRISRHHTPRSEGLDANVCQRGGCDVFRSCPEFFLDLELASSRWMMLNMIGTMRIACWQFSRSSSQSSSSTATQGPEAALCSTLNRKPDQLANSRAMDLRIQIYSSFLLFFFSILHFIHSYLPSFPPSLFFAGGAFSFQWGW